MMEIFKENGDNSLSINDRKLWSLCFACLYQYGCPVIFKTYGPNCPLKIDHHITFYIPRDHPEKFLVKEFLKNELETVEYEGKEMPDGSYAFGTKISICEFSGIDYYLERRDVEKIVKKSMKSFLDKIDKMKNNKKKEK